MQIPYIYFFSSRENVVLKQILHSSQWKRIFRLVETISFQYLIYPFHWKQFFHLLEIYFKRILYYSQWQRISCLLETIFFHSEFFGNHYCNWKEANNFKKNLISATVEETIFFNFFQILTRMEVFFRFSEITFFKESFILASWNGFPKFSSIFSIPNRGTSFFGWWKRIFYRMLHSSEWKRNFLVFFYSYQMLC